MILNQFPVRFWDALVLDSQKNDLIMYQNDHFVSYNNGLCRYICKSLVQAIPERAKEVDEARHRCGHQLRSNLWLFLENPSMNIYSKFFNILSVMFILVSTVSFCIETLPMFDDSYVNKEWVSFSKCVYSRIPCVYAIQIRDRWPTTVGRSRMLVLSLFMDAF